MLLIAVCLQWEQHAGLSTWSPEASQCFIGSLTLTWTGDTPHLDTGDQSLSGIKGAYMVMLFRLQRAWGFLTWGTKGKLATEFMIPFQEYCQELSLFVKKIPNTRPNICLNGQKPIGATCWFPNEKIPIYLPKLWIEFTFSSSCTWKPGIFTPRTRDTIQMTSLSVFS